jgi:hypothetical protein
LDWQLQALDYPCVGQRYRLEVDVAPGRAPAGVVALPMLALACARIPVPPLGVLFLDPAQTIVLPIVMVPAPSGRLEFAIDLPNDRNLFGAHLCSQVLLVTAQSGLLTNAVLDVVP